MIGRTNVGGSSSSEKRVTGTWTGTNSSTITITGIPFTPKAYAVALNGTYTITGYSWGQIGGVFADAYSYKYSYSSEYDGWSNKLSAPPRDGLWKATFSNGTLTITSAKGAFGYSTIDTYKYVVIG